MVEPLKRSTCCKLGDLAITWRLPNPVHGPEQEGWSMVVHTMVGPPEYANIIICPFCGQKPLNSAFENQYNH